MAEISENLTATGIVERAEVVQIPLWIRDAIVAHAVKDAPKEACGLLAGRSGRIEHLFRMGNADDSPVTYRLEPTEQLRVFREIEDRGWELAGIYHSHTHTEAYPSATDRRQAFYPEAVHVVISLMDATPVVRAFRIRDEVVEECQTRFV
jgi:proteasome lid subunit RPN8/RPN11